MDFETQGQIDSDKLHKMLVTPLAPGVRLTIIFDCCHSGTAVELPYVYRSDANGNGTFVLSFKLDSAQPTSRSAPSVARG